MHYVCSQCGRPIGLLADDKARAEKFRCPHTRRIAEAQLPVKR
jgi:DNA-directed RNA polymerase subunit RPC12/RpoP